MEYFRIIPSYKRDVYFQYDTERNLVDRGKLEFELQFPANDSILYYTVDKRDAYLKNYDFLPCIGPHLISKRFKELLEKFAPNAVRFYPAEIKFNDTEENNVSYYALIVTEAIACLDEQKSVVKPLLPSKPLGPKKIDTLYIDKSKVSDDFIFKIKNYEKIIMVSFSFLKNWNNQKFKGLLFAKEGSLNRPEFV
ncbi:MAG: hypothetical protein EOO60_03675 [Hymenobacter sp.]|nr:MAG: hypothetical protein EOO60_03675 [Hymenobacter sp.]